MSWQVRLGNLDEEIREFLENHPNFPVKEEKEFVKFAVRKLMTDVETKEEQIQQERERILNELKESIEKEN